MQEKGYVLSRSSGPNQKNSSCPQVQRYAVPDFATRLRQNEEITLGTV